MGRNLVVWTHTEWHRIATHSSLLRIKKVWRPIRLAVRSRLGLCADVTLELSARSPTPNLLLSRPSPLPLQCSVVFIALPDGVCVCVLCVSPHRQSQSRGTTGTATAHTGIASHMHRIFGVELPHLPHLLELPLSVCLPCVPPLPPLLPLPDQPWAESLSMHSMHSNAMPVR